MTDVDPAVHRLGEDVTFGRGAVDALPDVVRHSGAQRVLLVCGQRSFEASGAVRIWSRLTGLAEVERWSDFSPNTDAGDLEQGLAVLHVVDADLVLGVGGGSTMDMAKLLCAYHHLAPGDARDAIRAGERIETRSAHLVLAPTTSGSGSEATHFAVVYIGDEKFSIAGPAMLPDHVVLDPDLSCSGSPHQRATSGIDAACQAIESLWAAHATEESRAHARNGLRLVLEHLERFVTSPDPASAEGMALGSHLAGRAINISKTTAAHALSYGITKRHGVSHGHAVALSLGPFIELHASASPADLQEFVDPEVHARAMDDVLSALGSEDGADARRAFTDLLHRIGLEASLTALGIEGDSELRRLASSVNLERLGNNPVVCREHDLQRVLERAG